MNRLQSAVQKLPWKDSDGVILLRNLNRRNTIQPNIADGINLTDFFSRLKNFGIYKILVDELSG